MKDFTFRMPARVLFGPGKTAELGALLKKEGCRRVMILTDPVIYESDIFKKVQNALDKEKLVTVTYKDAMADPAIELVDQVAELVRERKVDAVVAVGGGSPIDLAKAVCMLQTNPGTVRDYLFGGSKTVEKPSLPLIAIPTTAGTGSEMTAASVITDEENKIKLSVTHDFLIPKLALIDPELHLGMPGMITASTGLDALTHAIEAYVSLNAEPISDALALQAIRMIHEHLRKAVANGQDIQARSGMALASLMAGAAFMNGGLGVVHGIAQSMGGLHHTPHGIANGLILPYAMERNYIGNLEKFKNIAAAMGQRVDGLPLREAASLSVKAVFDLQRDLGVPHTLKEVGISPEDFPPIVEGTMGYRLLAVNPCKLAEKDVEKILHRAYEG